MKTMLLFIIAQLFVCSNYTVAQNNKPVIINEDNLEYTLREDGWMQKKGTETLKAQSYIDSHVDVVNISDFYSLFEKAFTPERAKELSKGRLICIPKFDTIKKELVYVEYKWIGSEERIKLSELEQIDKIFKLEANFEYIHSRDTIVDKFTSMSILIKPERYIKK